MLGWPGPLTHRQFAAWVDWFDGVQHDFPSLDNLYQARVAQRVQQKFADEPEKVELRHQLVRPGELNPDQPQPRPQPKTKEELDRESEALSAMWGAWLGAKSVNKKR